MGHQSKPAHADRGHGGLAEAIASVDGFQTSTEAGPEGRAIISGSSGSDE